MDSQPLIFDVSSDEEFGFDNSSTNEDLDWIARLLDDVADAPVSNHEPIDLKNVEINKVHNNNVNVNVNDVDDDDDDVVIVGEVIVKPKGVKMSFSMMNNGCGDDDDDDDCVVLEFDPDKPPPSKVDNDEVKKCGDDDDDELVVVGEKGQVACRDFPHSRHLCANFPFSSTSHESRCELCHCYVCDSVAPCAYWGSGASTTDHCHATDKSVYWQTERKRSRQEKNPPAPSKPAISLGQFPQHLQPSARPLNPRVATSCSGPVPFGVANIVSQGRTQRPYIAVARDGYQRHLVSQQLLRVRNSSTQAQLATRRTTSVPIFKRHGLTSNSGVSNRAPLIWQGCDNVAVNSSGNTSANLQGASSQMVRNPGFCQSSTRTMTSQLPRYGLPNHHTQTSTFPSCGQPAPLVSDNHQYTNASMHQAQSISSPLIPCNTSNALKKAFQSSEQHPVEARNVSVPDFVVPTPHMSNNIPLMNHQELGALQSYSSTPTSTLNPPHSMEMGPHDFLQNVEKDSQMGLDFEVERWLDETVGEGFDLSAVPQQTAPIDTGMLYFDFETSWQGLAHS